jgi:hypothetical protein
MAGDRRWTHCWKTLTREGHAALSNGELVLACDCYTRSLDIARLELSGALAGNDPTAVGDAVVAYFITASNLAETCAQAGRVADGEAVMETVFTHVAGLLDDDATDPLATPSLLRNLKYPMTDYLSLGEPSARDIARRKSRLNELIAGAARRAGVDNPPEEARKC